MTDGWLMDAVQAVWDEEKTPVSFAIPGKVFFDYLDPNLDTHSAIEMQPYLAETTRHGRGIAVHYRDVPVTKAKALLVDMRNVAECRAAGDPEDMPYAYAIQRAAERVQHAIEAVTGESLSQW